MFRYFLAFLLLSTYSGSSGAPTKNAPNGTVTVHLISDWLDSLTPNCPNKFLTQQIKDHLEDCKKVFPPFHQEQLGCLMFYDISKQLCSASFDPKANLADDYLNKTKEGLDVKTACTQAKNWSVAELKEFPDYKKTVRIALNVSLYCEKLCGAQKIISQDTNFFCTYLKWGSEVLSALPDTAAEKGDNVSNPNEMESPPTQNFTGRPMVSEYDTNSAPEIIANNGNEIAAKTEHNNNIQTLSPGLKPSQLNNQNQIERNGPNTKSEKGVASPSTLKVTYTPPGLNKSIDIPDESAIRTPETDIDSHLNADPDPHPLTNNDDNDNENNGDDPADGPGADDFPEDENENSKNGLLKPNEETGIKTGVKRVDTALKHSEKELDNSYTYEYNDDHFFQFFLTGVILVVLLYVLYHNKSKVLGLIVEGRQPGRRRNSRGHAYKRLDTLEQAMSTNSTAPPSKIIY